MTGKPFLGGRIIAHPGKVEILKVSRLGRGTGTPVGGDLAGDGGACRAGKILYAGSSNFAGWHIARASETARARGFLGLVSEQSLYNLMTRAIELEVLPAAIAYGVGVIPWSPLEGGLLGGVLTAEREGRRRLAGRAKAVVEQHRDRIEAYEELCGKLGEQPANVALAWLLYRRGVTAPIVGPRTLAQLDGVQRALTVALDPDILGQLDEIFPGYKPAPEHYAW